MFRYLIATLAVAAELIALPVLPDSPPPAASHASPMPSASATAARQVAEVEGEGWA